MRYLARIAGATTTLTAGANKDLGFETAHQLVVAGHIVYIAPGTGRGGTPPGGSASVSYRLT